MNKDQVEIIEPLRQFIEHGAVADSAPEAARKLRAKAWQKLALAARAILKDILLTEKPELIQVCEQGYLEVYGGACIRRKRSGALAVQDQKKYPLTSVVINDIGGRLVQAANHAIYAEYKERVYEFIFKKADTVGIQLENHETQVKSCLEWMLENMRPAWWSRKGSYRVEAKTLMKRMWDFNILDREVFGMMTRVAGHNSNIRCYNACAENRAELAARIKEAPNLACMLWDDSYEGVGLRCASNVFQELREQFIAQGGTPAGWRWISHQGWATVFMAFRPQDWQHRTSPVMVANAFAQAQVGKVPAISRIWHHTRYASEYLDLVVGMVKTLTVAFRKRQAKARDLYDDIPLVWDFLRRHEASAKSMFKGATWKSLMRRQEEWHREQTRIARERDRALRGCYAWKELTPPVAARGILATSLNDSDALWEEGDAMGHCVGGYHHNCYRNESRIYSITGADGNRIATMEARRLSASGKWTLAQLYGQRNRRIEDPEVRALAKKVLALCNRAEAPKHEDNIVVREPVKPAPVQRAHRAAEELDEIPF